ncbi:DUF6119 family protein [Cytobacillus oceanisediminis]|uniref:Sporadically distributed protein, TIGR04141 family n=1 Tax=Cytobacillus oceanisediminis 2691 TaxID=1196031 RepID=A0A160MCF4_9BACI|nr:DUF6119 family protein [Cytobacillus oceanisediminis]AND40647.1 hypothetical protein A361_16295 [Cytobacillus oceanisediminis 2691]
MKLSYYLFNENVINFNQLILPEKVNEQNNYFELQPRNTELGFEFKVFIQRNRTKEPKWITLLENDLEIPNRDDIKNTVNSFVILVKVNKNQTDYFFAITGGFGFTAIDRNNLENNFGLKVALNSIDSTELKAFDVRNIDLKTKQKRVLINKGSELGEFDLNFEQDLINLVSGKSRDEGIGTSIKGSTSSLSLNSDVTFATLGEKCNQLLDLFLSDDYKENFGFIDNVKIVKDGDVTSDLNNNLFQALNRRETHNISLAYPDMIEYEKCSSYKIKKGTKTVETEEVNLMDLYSLLDKEGVVFDSADHIKKIKIIGFDEAEHPVTSPVTLNHFIIFQTELNENTYIFSLNNWYKIDNDYFSRIQEEIMRVPLVEDPTFLTPILIDESEGSYNDRQNSDYFLNMDKQNFQIRNSRSKIEVCDLLSKDKHFVCVKKETRSATLSHLFAQGSVSMQLLRESSEYRQSLVNKALEKFPRVNFNQQNFPFNECTLVYAISTSKTDDIRNVLPFFSKVNLLHHVNLIRRLGIKVEIYKIPVSHEVVAVVN